MIMIIIGVFVCCLSLSIGVVIGLYYYLQPQNTQTTIDNDDENDDDKSVPSNTSVVSNSTSLNWVKPEDFKTSIPKVSGDHWICKRDSDNRPGKYTDYKDSNTTKGYCIVPYGGNEVRLNDNFKVLQTDVSNTSNWINANTNFDESIGPIIDTSNKHWSCIGDNNVQFHPGAFTNYKDSNTTKGYCLVPYGGNEVRLNDNFKVLQTKNLTN